MLGRQHRIPATPADRLFQPVHRGVAPVCPKPVKPDENYTGQNTPVLAGAGPGIPGVAGVD